MQQMLKNFKFLGLHKYSRTRSEWKPRLKLDFHWEYFCSRMKKQKKKNSRTEKKVEQCSICKNQIQEKAENFSSREQKKSQRKTAFRLYIDYGIYSVSE